jgi:hypothetical protein
MSHPSYKKSDSYKQFNNYITATSYMYNAPVLQKTSVHSALGKTSAVCCSCLQTIKQRGNTAQ